MKQDVAASFVDAHCHVDLYKNPIEIIKEAESAHVYTIAVTNAPSVFRHTASLARNCKHVRAAVGLHPELVESHGKELALFPELLKETRYIGEVGLDYTTGDRDVKRKQRDVLTSIVGWADTYPDKILTLHSRRAAGDVISCVSSFAGKAILHWFTGSIRELERAVQHGFYFSINNAMLRSEKGSALIQRMPRDHVLTESDGPFVQIGSRNASPIDTKEAVNKLAALWNSSPEEAREIIIRNFAGILQTGPQDR